ncbi:MAG: ATP-binding cassette domain-containing protein [Steroidobacteraceae bacterium]
MGKRQGRIARLRAVELRDAGVRLGGRWALEAVTLTIRAGERWVVEGPNGAGKTLLLRLLRGELWPTATGHEERRYLVGRAWDGTPLRARARMAYLGPERQDRYERRDWDHRVDEVVGTGFEDTDIPLSPLTAGRRPRVLRALGRVGLAGLAERRLLSLSTGQRRRVLIARALVSDPDLVLFDEVMNGLDARARRRVASVLARLAADGVGWICTTHRPGDLPAGVTHRARLDRGRLVEAGPASATRRPAAGRTRSVAPRVAARPAKVRGPLLQFERVSVYRDGRRVVSGLDWTIAAGEHWAIAGPNGSGKSTLIALAYGDLPAAAGGNVRRAGLPRGSPISQWKSRVGLVSAELHSRCARLDDSVQDIVVSGLHSSVGLDARPGHRERRAAIRALEAVGGADWARLRPGELSYGQFRLVLFARALVAHRRLLLLDEPLDGLSAPARARALALLERASRAGTQVVIAAHHPEDVPAWVTRRLEFVRPGRAVAS